MPVLGRRVLARDVAELVADREVAGCQHHHEETPSRPALHPNLTSYDDMMMTMMVFMIADMNMNVSPVAMVSVVVLFLV